MRTTLLHLRRAVVVGLLAALARPSQAQDALEQHHVTQRGWLDFDAGIGILSGSDPSVSNGFAFAGSMSAAYSAGPLVIEARRSGAAEFWGDHVDDWSGLVGVRNIDRIEFLSAATGIARARFVHRSEGGGFTSPDQSVLAYQLGAGRHGRLAGLGVTMFGVAGPRLVHYTAAGLSLQLGKLW